MIFIESVKDRAVSFEIKPSIIIPTYTLDLYLTVGEIKIKIHLTVFFFISSCKTNEVIKTMNDLPTAHIVNDETCDEVPMKVTGWQALSELLN